MKYMYMFYEGAVSPEICNQLVARFSEENYEAALVGTNTGILSKDIRDADRQWANKNDLVECILTRFIMQANQEALWNFDITEPEQVQIGRYRENQFYGQHMDCYIKGSDIIMTGRESAVVIPLLSQRKISASLLLNDESSNKGYSL